MRAYGDYPSNVTDEEWAFVAPYLCLMVEAASQRRHSLRAVFDGLRWMVRAGAPWRLLPRDLPPWQIVHQQAQRWLRAGVFEEITRDLRMLLRLVAGRHEQPTAAVLDARTLHLHPGRPHLARPMNPGPAYRSPPPRARKPLFTSRN